MGPIFFSGPRGNSRARSALRSLLERRESALDARIAPAARAALGRAAWVSARSTFLLRLRRGARLSSAAGSPARWPAGRISPALLLLRNDKAGGMRRSGKTSRRVRFFLLLLVFAA